MGGVDPQLVRAVREGTYVVDAAKVAEAILRRDEDRRLRLAEVLEAIERDGAPGRGPQDDSLA